jgi:zinc protease
MRFTTRALSLVCSVAFAASVSLASIAAEAAPRVEVTRATLPNGLRIVVLRDRLAPVVTTWLNVDAGSNDEAFDGLAHAQEHMFYRGSRTLGGPEADQIAGFTGDEDNADTQSEITQYFHLVPAADLDLALHLDASRFAGILDAPRDWLEERGAIEQEVTRNNSDASYRLGVKILHHVMAGTRYANDGLGTLESFGKQIGSPQLRAFYDTWYHPNNALYVIAGDIDPQVAIASVRRSFGAMPAAKLPAHVVGKLTLLAPATFTDTSDQSTIEAEVAYRYPGFDDPAYAAAVVLGDVLNSQRGDLFGLVAAGRAQSVEADVSTWPEAGMLQLISRVAIGTKPRAAIADLGALVARYRAHGVSASLVEAAKRREIVRVQTAAANVETLAQTWSQTLAVEHRTPDDDVAAIASVTPAAVDAVVRAYLVPATATVAYAIPKSGGSSDTVAVAASDTNAKKTTTAAVHLPLWATNALHHLALPKRTIAPTTFVLSNGLHVVVQPEHASPYVAVNGTIAHDAGLEEPADKTGVQSVVEALLPYGTTQYSRVAYQGQIDAISATVVHGFTFTLGVPSANFARGMTLLADAELHPAFDAASFAIVKNARSADLAGDATNPDHLALVATANGLYPENDPARRFATADGVRALSLPDIKAAYARAFRPDLATIAIVGDVSVSGAKAIAERTFGSWRAAGARPDVFPHPVVDNGAREEIVAATGRLQDTVVLTQALALGIHDPDIAQLRIANTILSGDFSSVLIRDMRVTTGYVYSVGSALASGLLRSTFVVRYGCAPENFAKAQAVLERDLEHIASSRPDGERLLRAKSRLLSDVALQSQSYDGLAARLTTNVGNGFSADRDFALARAELAATPDSVRAAVARWIRPSGFVRVIEGPAPRLTEVKL